MKVFVYGTLKKGFHNHRCLEGARFVTNAHLSVPFRMFDTGGFPVLLPATASKPGYFPTGEVYELPEGRPGELILARLDRLEGEGSMYHRQEHQTMDGEVVSVYIGDERTWRRLDNQAHLGKNIKVDEKLELVSYTRAA